MYAKEYELLVFPLLYCSSDSRALKHYSTTKVDSSRALEHSSGEIRHALRALGHGGGYIILCIMYPCMCTLRGGTPGSLPPFGETSPNRAQAIRPHRASSCMIGLCGVSLFSWHSASTMLNISKMRESPGILLMILMGSPASRNKPQGLIKFARAPPRRCFGVLCLLASTSNFDRALGSFL